MTHSDRPVTLITGATGGIGTALARELAGQHTLVLQGRAGARLLALCAELGALPLPLDLTRPETFEAALAGLGRVTNVVQNAGVVELGAVAEQPPEVWTHTLAVNVVAPAALTRLLLPRVRAERGTLVFINSGREAAGQPWLGELRRQQVCAAGAGRRAARGGGAVWRARVLGLSGPHRHPDAAEGPGAGGCDLRPSRLRGPADGGRHRALRARGSP